MHLLLGSHLSKKFLRVPNDVATALIEWGLTPNLIDESGSDSECVSMIASLRYLDRVCLDMSLLAPLW